MIVNVPSQYRRSVRPWSHCWRRPRRHRPAGPPKVSGQSRLDGDLLLDETELAALGEGLRRSFGPSVDLAALRAGLDLAALEALTVADVERLLPAEGTR